MPEKGGLDDYWSGYAGAPSPVKERQKKAAASAGGDAPGKQPKKDPSKMASDKKKDDAAPAKSETQTASAAVSQKDVKGKKQKPPSPQTVEPERDSEREEAEYRAMKRRQRFKRRWPKVTKVKIKTKPWSPPGPPEKMPKVEIELPPLTTRPWVPPFRRRRRPRPKLPRISPDAEPFPMFENHTLKRIWHNFTQVDKNKMMIQGTRSCNNKRYQPNLAGAQTGCIAMVARGLLHDKHPSELNKQDVDDVIEAGNRLYKRSIIALKCYKGKPALQLNQILPYYFFRDYRYTVKMTETDQGILAKHVENPEPTPDLMGLMEKLQGQTYMKILTINGSQHFLIWGHPPEDGGSCKTICYIFDPFMLSSDGSTEPLNPGGGCCKYNEMGAGAILRYPGTNSFVLDFLNNHMDPEKYKDRVPTITLTDIEIFQKDPIIREPAYDLDLKSRKPHCRAEFDAINTNILLEEKLREGKHALASLSATSLATEKSDRRKKIHDFLGGTTATGGAHKEVAPAPPVPPEKPPPVITTDQILSQRGENFFLYTPDPESHLYGRDDMIPLPKDDETNILHSPAEIADKNFKSQYQQMEMANGGHKYLIRATRHFATRKYNLFKNYTGVACCVAALAMLKRYRARAWNEDVLDETLDVGYNLFRESLVERHGPIRQLVLGELKEEFKMRDKTYKHKEKGICVWGKVVSRETKVLDICRGLDYFFKEADSGILQIPGEFECAIWYEGGKYYCYHPWPANSYGNRVGLQDGGKACILFFTKIADMCDYFMENFKDMKRRPYSISCVNVFELEERPEPMGQMKAVGPNRWMVRGHFHEGDEQFPEPHRNKQATPTAITAIAMASIVDPSTWTPADVDEVLVRGDILYENTMENLEKLGINFDQAGPNDEGEGEEEEPGPTGTLAAADVLPRFRVTEYDCIETDVNDSAFSGQLNPEPGSDLLSLKDSLKLLFKDNKAGVVTARGCSMAVWEHDDHYYFFDPHGCDENGYPTDDPRAGAALIRIKKDEGELADIIMANLPPGADDSYNLSPVEILAAKLNPEIGAPEMKKENRQFEWLQRNRAAILMGPRGENAALGKANTRAHKEEDLAGRTIGLCAAAAFCAAAEAIPVPGMHKDHMFNFLDAGAEYYLNHLKKTGRKDIGVDDLNEKFEMGANTFSIEVGESTRLPLRMPDKEPGEGGDDDEDLGEGEVPEPGMKEMKDLLSKMWYDTTKPIQVALLLGDYHQLGIWLVPGGRVIAFDPAPTLEKGALTPQRIAKGDQLRLQRIKDETPAEEGDEGDDEEAGGEGEQKPEPEPEFVPPESCPVIFQAASPGEFIDKLVQRGGLNNQQMIAPYWLYPVKVTNELTSVLKERKPSTKEGDEEGAGGDEAEEEIPLVERLEDESLGEHFARKSRTIASVRGMVAQGENYFVENPNRNHQDAANCIMGIVVNDIEPAIYWKSSLIDAILKYGDRLYTLSLPKAAKPPRLTTEEVVPEFHVTNFDVKVEVHPETVIGDIRAHETGTVLNLRRGIQSFFDDGHKYGVVCAKGYCAGIWPAADGNSYYLWEPHFVGPMGRTSPAGAAGLIQFSTIDELAETLRLNIEDAARPGINKYTISEVKPTWLYSRKPPKTYPQGKSPDEGYDYKVLTAYVEYASGRTILRGTRPLDYIQFAHDALLQSAASAIVGACMSNIRRSHLWSYKIVDEIMSAGTQLFGDSITNLGYEFRPGEDVLMPLQVLRAFMLGSNYVRYDLVSAYSGKLEQKQQNEMTLRAALESFFQRNTHGIIWCSPYATAVWRTDAMPEYYMFEPHACGPNGLRLAVLDDAAACVMTFSSPKLMAHAYLQNTPTADRAKYSFDLYAMTIVVTPIPRQLKPAPGLLNAPPPMVPATSKVDAWGRKRRADDRMRHHPPGDTTCLEAYRATVERDKEDMKFKGHRNTNGWLVLNDGSQFMSANHSMDCKKFPYASRGNQALACSVMAVAMSRVEDVCRWCVTTLDQILESGDQLYQDSYLHYRPKDTKILSIEQILRKFYTPGNCVCRVVVYEARQTGKVDTDLVEKLTEFFREERAGVFVARNGDFAVALFRTPRGYYMFDPGDRDRYGRAVAPPCTGKARACFSQYPTVASLAEKLGANIPPMTKEDMPVSKGLIEELIEEGEKASKSPKSPPKSPPKTPPLNVQPGDQTVHFEGPAPFAIYGMQVSSLRRTNQYEK